MEREGVIKRKLKEKYIYYKEEENDAGDWQDAWLVVLGENHGNEKLCWHYSIEHLT
jgi:hypothetical protein